MNHGCTIMTWKQSSSLCNGRRHPLCDRKKRAKFAATSSQCWSCFFFDIRGIVHKEFIPPGQTVNGKFYCEVLRQLRGNVRRKRPEMWKNRDWLLHHNNAPAHTSLVVRAFLTKNNMTTVPHPVYLPDLAPLRFLCVPENETPAERAAFHIHWRVPSRIATSTKHANAGRLQWVLPKMAKSLGSLYTSPRWRLRRWRWKLGLKVFMLLWANSQKFWVAPHIETMNKIFGNNYLPIFWYKITIKSNTYLWILWAAMDFICQIRKMLRRRTIMLGIL